MGGGREGGAIMLRFMAVLVLLFGCGAFVFGCTAPESSGPAGEPPAATSTAQEPEVQDSESAGPPALGEDITIGPWGMKVGEPSVEDEAPGRVPAPAGKELMFVPVSLWNTGDATLTIESKAFELKDSAGVAVATFGTRQGYNALDMSPLGPGYGTTTTFIYAVDPGSTGYTFSFAPGTGGQAAPVELKVR